MFKNMQTCGALIAVAVIVALAIYYGGETRSGYFYYDKEGRKVEVKQRE
jgi:hypothetical protein